MENKETNIEPLSSTSPNINNPKEKEQQREEHGILKKYPLLWIPLVLIVLILLSSVYNWISTDKVVTTRTNFKEVLDNHTDFVFKTVEMNKYVVKGTNPNANEHVARNQVWYIYFAADFVCDLSALDIEHKKHKGEFKTTIRYNKDKNKEPIKIVEKDSFAAKIGDDVTPAPISEDEAKEIGNMIKPFGGIGGGLLGVKLGDSLGKIFGKLVEFEGIGRIVGAGIGGVKLSSYAANKSALFTSRYFYDKKLRQGYSSSDDEQTKNDALELMLTEIMTMDLKDGETKELYEVYKSEIKEQLESLFEKNGVKNVIVEF